MATYDVADLLSRFKRQYNRPSADEAWTDQSTDDVAYQFLNDGQQELATRIAWHVPEVGYGRPIELTTSDDGLTYGFGTDTDGNPIVPLGQIELRAGVRGIPILPGNDWDNSAQTYLLVTEPATGQTLVTFPGQLARTFASGLWARFVTLPAQITGPSSLVSLAPFNAREMIPYFAAQYGCLRIEVDPAPYEARKETVWANWLGAMKNQQFGAGTRALGGGFGDVWWKGNPDLGNKP